MSVHHTTQVSELADQATLDQVHLTVCITEYKQCFNIYNYYTTHKTIDEAKQELINIIFNKIKMLNIDFPLCFDHFENIWFQDQSINSNMFSYKIVQEDKWVEPWSYHEIYLDVLDKIQLYENENKPVVNSDNEEDDLPDLIPEENINSNLEQELRKIIDQAKIVHNVSL
jgi:hypothetical protein